MIDADVGSGDREKKILTDPEMGQVYLSSFPILLHVQSSAVQAAVTSPHVSPRLLQL